MNMKYTAPEFQVIELEVNTVLCASEYGGTRRGEGYEDGDNLDDLF